MVFALPDEVLKRGNVRASISGDVVEITLDRPEARNPQTPATWTALAAIGALLEDSPEIARVVVIRGAGTAFSAGLDRRMFTAEGVPGEMSLAQLTRLSDVDLASAIAGFQEAFLWQRRVPAITVAAVHGPAIGAGFQLALACDVLLATAEATFAMRETSYGLVPDLAGTHPLVTAVGYSRAMELCATGRVVSADEGYVMGFVTRVVEDLDEAVAEMALSICATPPGAVEALTSLLADSLDRTRVEQAEAERHAQVQRLRALMSGG